ncbi:MAG: MAPEG family protein [Erythrobacter sp.]
MLPITSFLAAILGVLLVGLSFSVSLKRMKLGTDLGLGEDETLHRRIRAQGNFIEYAPIALILCGLAELRDADVIWLQVLAGLLLLGRVAHAMGMISGSTPLRASGMLATYGSILLGSFLLILK